MTCVAAPARREIELEAPVAEIRDPVMANVVTQLPAGDMLVNELQIGSLDAVIAYVSNGAGAADKLAGSFVWSTNLA